MLLRATYAVSSSVLLLARVFAAAVQLQVPEKIHVLVKKYDSFPPTVDRVDEPVYVGARSPNPMPRQWSAHVDFRLIADFCDCRDEHPNTNDRVFIDYGMWVYADGESAYFSAHGPEVVSSSDGQRRHYGPFPPAVRSTADGQEPSWYVVPKNVLMEWAQQELESEPSQQYFWNRTAVAAKKPYGHDRDVQVTFSAGSAHEQIARFARDECLNISRSGVHADLTVDRGGCVLAFEDDRCGGDTAPRMFVQEPAGLYAIAGPAAAAAGRTVPGARSLTGCHGHELDLTPVRGRRRPLLEELLVDPVDCSCGAEGAQAGPDERPQWRAIPERSASSSRKPPVRRGLSELNAAAGAAMELAKEAAVSAATRGTSYGRRVSVSAAIESLRTVAETGGRYAFAAAGRVEQRALYDLENAVRLADRAVRLAMAAAPEAAVTYVMWAVRSSGDVPELVARSHRRLAAGRTGEPRGKRPRARGRRSASRGPRPDVTTAAGAGERRDVAAPGGSANGGGGEWTHVSAPGSASGGEQRVVVLLQGTNTRLWLPGDVSAARGASRNVVKSVPAATDLGTAAIRCLLGVFIAMTVLLVFCPRYVHFVRGLFAPRTALALVCVQQQPRSRRDDEEPRGQPCDHRRRDGDASRVTKT